MIPHQNYVFVMEIFYETDGQLNYHYHLIKVMKLPGANAFQFACSSEEGFKQRSPIDIQAINCPKKST